MSKFRDKMPVFFLGLLFGITIAGGFFILKLDDYFKNLKLYENVSESISNFSKEQMEKETEKINNKQKEEEKKQKSNLKPQSSIPVKNNLPLTIDLDSSIYKDKSAVDSIYVSEISSDEIVVKKDELLSTNTIKIIFVFSDNMPKTDTLLSKVSGVEKDAIKSEFIQVQYWQSPLNFKGYKMSKNKLMLYGLPSAEEVKLYSMDDFYFMKYQNVYYQLEYSSDFRPYKVFNNNDVIAKLK